MNEARSRQSPPGGRVRVGPLMAIPAILSELGHEPNAILVAAGANPAQFADPDTEIPYLTAGKLVARCVATTGCGHFGLLVGQRAGPSALGVGGFMLQTAPDVATALRDLVQHLDLHEEGGSAVLQTQGRVSRLGYVIHQPGVEATDQIHDVAIAVGCNIMRRLCGRSWNPTDVFLPRRPPEDLAPFRRFFRAPLHFNADQSAILFPTKWLDHKLRSADALLHRHLEKEAMQLHAVRETNLVIEVRTRLLQQMSSGRCTVADIAEQLCMHERTLHRRLRENGTSFRREAEGVRYELARRLLADTTMSIMKIASALNYSDASAFNRAFKRWTEVTPARWRVRAKKES